MTRRRGGLLSCFGVGFLLVSSNVIERAGREKRVATGEAEQSEEEEDVGEIGSSTTCNKDCRRRRRQKMKSEVASQAPEEESENGLRP